MVLCERSGKAQNEQRSGGRLELIVTFLFDNAANVIGIASPIEVRLDQYFYRNEIKENNHYNSGEK